METMFKELVELQEEVEIDGYQIESMGEEDNQNCMLIVSQDAIFNFKHTGSNFNHFYC